MKRGMLQQTLGKLKELSRNRFTTANSQRMTYILIAHEEQGNRDGGNRVPQADGCLLQWAKHFQLDLDELKQNILLVV